MATTQRVHLVSPFGCETQVRVSYYGYEPVEQFNGIATIVIDTGGCSVQTYANAEKLRELGKAFFAAAVAVEADTVREVA